MKYYSEKTKKFYDTATACLAGESEYDAANNKAEKAKAEKEARTKELNDARAAVNKALDKYYELRKKYNKDYPDVAKAATDKAISDMLTWLFS